MALQLITPILNKHGLVHLELCPCNMTLQEMTERKMCPVSIELCCLPPDGDLLTPSLLPPQVNIKGYTAYLQKKFNFIMSLPDVDEMK